MRNSRRFIEETFPVKEVGIESSKEKTIRHGHPSTLHVWWARKPLGSSRATAYASLISSVDSSTEKEQIREFIIEYSKWKNTFNQRMRVRAQNDILSNNDGKRPRILDPFAGGGSIPLEALRLGCEVYSSDINPVAVILQKCMMEYPQKYGHPREASRDNLDISASNPLAEDVKYWANWIKEQAMRQLAPVYQSLRDGEDVVAYYWARYIKCQNPNCGIKIPLLQQFWLARKNTKRVALYPYIEEDEIKFRIVGDGYKKMPENFNPSGGTIKTSIVVCPSCGSSIDSVHVRRIFQNGESEERIVSLIINSPKGSGKIYRIASKTDQENYQHAKKVSERLHEDLFDEIGYEPIPNEPIHTPDGKPYQPGQPLYNFTPVLLYGFTRWGDLHNERQRLYLMVFSDLIRKAYTQMIRKEYDSDYAAVIRTYLGVIFNRLVDKSTILVRFNQAGEKVEQTFGRPALSMIWGYAELNPFTSVGWGNATDWVLRNIENLSRIGRDSAQVKQTSAMSLPYPGEYFDAVMTDPPYYDNIPYCDLSDFFYVWLKRTVGELYPDLFSTPLTPKSDEIIAELPLLRGLTKDRAHEVIPNIKTKEHFEKMLMKAFKEIYRVLRKDGLFLLVYAHKSTEGWETLVNSLVSSGLVVTCAWPVNTEMGERLRARESATLASSIYIVARKRARESTAIYKDVKEELESHLERKLHNLWREGIGGADFFVAAIGSAIEVFGKYKEVIDYEGNIIRAGRLLDDVREIATDFAVQQILHNGFSERISPLTRFYLLYRWNYQATKVHFDEARKLAQSCGIDLADQWGNSAFLRKQKEFIEVVGPKERKIEDVKESSELVDVLHYVLLLWEKGKKGEISKVLSEKKLENNESFWRVAQAISETLPTQNKEKKLLDGFLSGRTGYQSDDRFEQETLG